jgi:hypothetical protein
VRLGGLRDVQGTAQSGPSQVPSSLRLPISKALRDTWLEQAMEWARQAPQRGNAWTASDHHWNLIYRPDTGFIVDAG